MRKKTFSYRHPAEFPIPEGTEQIDCLKVTIPQAIGILELLASTDDDHLAYILGAVEAAITLLRQSDRLVADLLKDLTEENMEVVS